MNIFLAIAGVLSLLTGLVHATLGAAEFHRPMLASRLGAPAKAAWSVVWHHVTALLLLNGAALLVAARHPERAADLAALPLLLSAAFGALFMGCGLLHLRSLRLLPQWTAFLAITGFGLAGLLT